MYTIVLLTLVVGASLDQLRTLKLKDLGDFSKKDGLNVILIQKQKSEQLEKTMSTLAEVFKGFVRITSMEYSDDLPEGLKASKYPTIKILSDGGKSIVEFTKPAEPQDLYEYISSRVQEITKKKFETYGFVEPDTYVITLDETNFTAAVRDSEDHYLVEFYAPWCGHCQNLAPEWKEAAKQLRGKIKLAAVDCTVNQRLASDFGIKGYPTIKFIPAHSADPYKSAQQYDGGRKAQTIVYWVDSKLPTLLPPPAIHHITSQSDLDRHCFSKSLCVLAFFPNRLDSDSKTWTKYISVLKEASESQREMGYGWAWIEGGLDEKFEDAFGVGGFGYPALAVVSHKKKAYSIMKESFETGSIKRFLISLGSKSVETKTVSGEIPALKQAKEWDGKVFEKTEL